jgi:hypothetical protein
MCCLVISSSSSPALGQGKLSRSRRLSHYAKFPIMRSRPSDVRWSKELPTALGVSLHIIIGQCQ